MRRKSRARVVLASSAIAPAISTPVGPAPITTNVMRATTLVIVVAHLGLFEGKEQATANCHCIFQCLRCWSQARPFIVAEVVVL